VFLNKVVNSPSGGEEFFQVQWCAALPIEIVQFFLSPLRFDEPGASLNHSVKREFTLMFLG